MELKNTIQAMQKLGSKVVREGKSILKREKKTTKQNTLYREFDYTVRGHRESVSLIFDFGRASDYWDFVDEGVKGSGGFKGSGKARGQGSPFRFRKKNIAKGVVAKWIQNKPIKLRGKDGKFIEKTKANIKSAAFLIGRAIAQRGLQRTQFFTRPFTKELKNQTDDIVRAFGDDLDKQLELIIND
tara:strand:+ start:115 stop:669 length:555 start_codon:yes stop_codon:yes gene_type:complete